MEIRTNETGRRFDWLAFLTRAGVGIGIATYWLIERAHKQNRSGIVMAVLVGYVLIPALAYLHTRYSSRRSPQR